MKFRPYVLVKQLEVEADETLAAERPRGTIL